MSAAIVNGASLWEMRVPRTLAFRAALARLDASENAPSFALRAL
jgi:hypothetical protein